MPDVKTRDFSTASAVSILDPQMRMALQRAGSGFDGARRECIDEVTPQVWEEWREQARQVKLHTLDHLDYYLDLLDQRVSANGGQVHFAADAAEANAIVADLVRTREVKVATKSKSMVSEELNLNHELESIGVDVYETDLGEYIIQLAGETPFHLVAPAPPQEQGRSRPPFHGEAGSPADGGHRRTGRRRPRRSAGTVPPGGPRYQRRQLPDRRNRHPSHHHQRRQTGASALPRPESISE